MKKISVLPFLSLACLALTLTEALAQTRLVNIQTVTVGDAGNAPQNSFDSRGAVGYPYRIGKFEITVEQYTAFLNSVASTTTNNYLITLWNLQMGDKPWYAGVDRSGNGTPSDPYKYTVIGNANFPIDNVSWFDAARFCNWLHNGATNGASTETGAYTLNGATDGVIDKNTNAKWWIPSFNEWWKAAYYKGGSTNAGYWTYPTQSDTRPGNLIGGGTNQANYAKDLIYSVTQTTGYSPLQDYRTAVGTFSNSPSAYGTFDQAGNILEWNDQTFQGYVTALVGGNWNSAEGELSGTTSAGTWDRGREWPGWGFRVAGVPDEDADDDGVTDYRENKDGTDPNDATSFNPLSKGLVAYYPFDGNANDESGYGNNGDEYGVAYSSDRLGTPSTAADFRNNAYIEVPGLRSLKNYPITYSVWMYLESYHTALSWRGWGEMFLLGKDEPGVGNGAVISIHTGLDIQGVEHVDNVLGYSGFLTDYVPALGKWTLVTLSIDTNRQATFYINGLPIASWSATTQYNFEFTDLPFRVSTPYIFDQFARQSFQGYMDSIRIYGRALSATEVAQLYINDMACITDPNSGLMVAAEFLTSFGFQRYSSGVAEVTNNPASVGLFTQSQFDSNRTAGQSDVINNPMSYGLYTSDSIMDLRMGGLMIQKIGANAVVSFQPQTTTDLTLPFTNNGTPITNTVPMPGNKGFLRINAKPEQSVP
jgi:formylglycine-generating enzyme required for sulfatase activity